MRTCLSFLVCEYMHLGLSPQEACKRGIERVMTLPSIEKNDKFKSPPKDKTFHEKLTVGVIAMDNLGNIGAASTLCEDNLHRNNPFFPALCWRQDFTSKGDNDLTISVLEASIDGASF